MTQQRFKPFFFHYDALKSLTGRDFKSLDAVHRHRPRGFTLLVTPSEHPHQINVQVAFCSPKDVFSKKIGRATAVSHPITTINSRELPKFISEQEKKTTFSYSTASYYNHMLKYIV